MKLRAITYHTWSLPVRSFTVFQLSLAIYTAYKAINVIVFGLGLTLWVDHR